MKQVLITGASRGIGLALTQLHLEHGDYVFAFLRKSTAEIDILQRNFENLQLCFCDIQSEEEISHAVREHLSNTEYLDIVYNIAGLNLDGDGIPLDMLNFNDCLSMYNVNALGPLRILSCTLPLLNTNTVIVNVTSESGSIGACERTSSYGYCMSKAAANMATKIFSNAYPEIRIFCVHPGWVQTDMGGPRAKVSPYSITPRQSAEFLYDISAHPEQFPADVLYIDEKKQPMIW